MSDDGTAAPARSPARWETIAARLREDLAAGRPSPGERLPNETELASRFGVNRHTLRQAVRALEHDGLVRVVHGSGTFVREVVLDYALRRRTRMTENLASVGERARRELLSHRVAPAGDFASALRVAARDEAEWIATRATVRGRAVAVSTAVFPLPRLAGIAAAVAAQGSITAALATLGIHDYTRARSVVSARLPSPVEADALARPGNQPVLVVHYTNVDRDDVAIEAGITVFAADAVQLTVQPEGVDQ